MKKILAMALALLFVAALFTGCSKKVESPSEPNANDVASDTTEEAKERTSADNTDADSRTVRTQSERTDAPWQRAVRPACVAERAPSERRVPAAYRGP